ncbi:Nicotinate-nucleotide adenylyltransferase [hydrothermal vent metagenome]|uniref:Nicotinate-nucleotide adenylyltransferase n=1 Tax=hydrothermal vent metagenome TaxID=652676 RepID=A0A3B1A0J9_9ZZZZ
MIGVYGGTFDPIHFGHLRPILDVINKICLDKCYFIPCREPHHRSMPLASSKQRIEMIAAAIQAEPRFVLDTREIDRDGISYTVDTLESIVTEFSDEQTLCLILGVDAFVKFDQWHRWQDILDMCHIVVTHRPGWDVEKLVIQKQISNKLSKVVELRRIYTTDELNQHQVGKIIFQTVTQLDISATTIRALIAENNSIQYLTPKDVITIINNQKIYMK